MKRISLYIFLIAASSNILSQFFEWGQVGNASKPLIVLSLLVYYWVSAVQRNNVFMLALIFCWLGDVSLMFQETNPVFFMAGLGSFLCGHILYIFSYRQHQWPEGNGLLGPQKVRFSLPIILAGTGLVVVLYPSLGDLRIPVMLYAGVITIMTMQALFRFGFTTTSSFSLVFSGAILFMISDSVLAFNKFLSPVPKAGVIIMTTYGLAQILIVLGILKHTER